jgi:hypothetical protein
MGFRFQKRIRIFKGLTLNLSNSGTSWTIGGPGASVNVRGEKVTGTVGAPGTGLSYRQTLTDESEHDGSEPSGSEHRRGTPLGSLVWMGLIALAIYVAVR